MKDLRTCPVCGATHLDHEIEGEAAWWAPIWEATICDACDDWARGEELKAMGPAAGKLILYWGAGIGGPAYLRGRA